ncbi:PRKR-interacting protein 1-like [Elysia marginata]|uniref:PRKR-interacting protein 1-like n=1 Tax=Elysia marginata TaxID=1093978 RepID=A0AAV4HQ34_9GAST|nr:PRKR-interacting protein 1-like [Elysia marginata]
MAASTEDVSKETQKSQNDDKPVRVIKTPVDLQRLKLEKLMNNPTKEVIIPEKSKEKAPRAPLEFIRNIWGSSAGAGSGDFHVYRGVRRREYARQKFINEKAEKEGLDEAYKQKIEQNRKEAVERTAKNKAKSLPESSSNSLRFLTQKYRVLIAANSSLDTFLDQFVNLQCSKPVDLEFTGVANQVPQESSSEDSEDDDSGISEAAKGGEDGAHSNIDNTDETSQDNDQSNLDPEKS